MVTRDLTTTENLTMIGIYWSNSDENMRDFGRGPAKINSFYWGGAKEVSHSEPH